MSLTVSIRRRLSPAFSLNMEFETTAAGGGLGILGASGSGKSMTLKCIAGIEIPDEGHISLNGRVLFDSAKRINLKPQARRVGYLFQNYALFPQMTVMGNIRSGLPLPQKEAERKAGAFIERFELSALENLFPHELSGGQQQRTALARMLIREPELVLLDEPFSALDTNLREQIQLQFLDMIQSRQDVILVTHSRDEVFKLCGETLVMDAGTALAKGETRTLFQNPGTVRAAALTGCKNISAIKQTGEQEIYALDWGLSLRTALPVEQGITHVGIRAHDFKISRGEGYNQVRPAIKLCAEEPFEKVIIFTNADVYDRAYPYDQHHINRDSPGKRHELWWKYSKYLSAAETPEGNPAPVQLFIPPSALLLLR
jgi:molybdate transport system ATP-binding protein